MTSQSDYWTYATPTPQSSTGPPQPRARQPLGPASLVLIPTPTRSQAYAMNTSPLFHHRSNDEMTPLIHRNASAKPGHSPSPTPPSMTTQPSPSPHTPSTASSGASVPIKLAGIQPPAPFIGPYPVAYLNKDPVPSDHNDAGDNDASDLRRSSRQGAASCNPWDYVMTDETSKDGEESKGKVRRRFKKRELEALEVLWSISKSPTKYQRQRLGAWLGV